MSEGGKKLVAFLDKVFAEEPSKDKASDIVDMINGAQIRILSEENTKLRAQLAAKEQELEQLNNFEIEELHYENGCLDMWGSHPIVRTMAEETARLLKINNAENFITVSLRDKENNEYELIVKKAKGKTTATVINELRERAEQAEADTAALRKRLEPVEEVWKLLKKAQYPYHLTAKMYQAIKSVCEKK